MNELISVIIPIYNDEKYLESCVESVLGQTYTNIEIILVNDGSTDSTPLICEQLKQKDNRIKVLHKNNGGVGETRNMGLAVATGEYISFVDNDDCMETEQLETLYYFLKKTNADVVIGNFYEYSEENNIFKFYISEKDYFEQSYTPEEWMHQQYNGIYNISQCFTVPWGKLYKRTLFDNIAYPDNQPVEDDFTTWKVYLSANKIYFINKALYMHRKSKESITQKVSLSDVFPLSSIEERITLMSLLGMDITHELEAYKYRLALHEKELLKDGTKNIIKYKNVVYKRNLLEKIKKEI